MTIAVMLFAFSFLLLASPALAQTPTPSTASSSLTNSYPLPPSIPTTSPIYTDLLVHNLFHTFSCLAVGQSMIGQPCLTYKVTQNAQGAVQSVPVLSKVNLQGGALGATTSVIGALYQNPPVRTVDYLASIKGFGVVKEANAQNSNVVGSGQAVLNPIITLWQVSRNISYVIMIIIFVIIGLMVMFRNRINPQTVITAQTALPGLVIGLILITFSYFLAGLISDVAFIGTNVVGYYFAAAQGRTDDPERINLVQQISPESVLSIFSRFTGIVTRDQAEGAFISIFDRMSGEVQTYIRILVGLISAQFTNPLTSAIPPPIGLWLSPVLSGAFGITAASTPSFWLGWVLGFVATMALVYQMIILLLRLLNSYLTIIFLTLSAPFQFMIASLPGRQGIATGWLMNMLGNILVFPAVLAVFYFVAFILGPDFGQDFGPIKVTNINREQNSSLVSTLYAQETTSNPNMIVGKNTFPLFGGMDLRFIKILLAFGALMALPSIPGIVVKSIGKVGQAGQLIGQEISGGIRSGRGYIAQGQGAAGGQLGSWKTGLFGDVGGPVWNPEAIAIRDPATGAVTGYKGAIVYPRRPGLLRK